MKKIACIILPILIPSFSVMAVGNTPTVRNDLPVYTVETFFKNPQKSEYTISPDGKTIAFLQADITEQNLSRKNIYIQRIVQGKPAAEAKKLTQETLRDIETFFWKGQDNLVYLKDNNGDENYHLVSVNIHDGKIRDLTPFKNTRAGIVYDVPEDPSHILISHNHRNEKEMDVYRVNITNGNMELIAQNPGNVQDWKVDSKGKVRIAVGREGLNSTVLYRENESASFKPLIVTDYSETVLPLYFSHNNRDFYAVSNRGRDTSALVVIDPATPNKEKVIFSTENVDLGGVTFSRKYKEIVAVNWEDEKTQHHFFNPQWQEIYDKVRNKFPGKSIGSQGQNSDESLFIITVGSDLTPGAYYLYDVKHDSVALLSEINPDLKESDMSPMQPIQYQARDGLTIHGYLTLPKGRDTKNLACIVNPHGGPWTRDIWGFNPEVQFLANQGICVLQMNFRGSAGYGRKFLEAGYGQWGLKMQDDITDAAKWLITEGIADPKRLGIYGASYGGYATLAGIAFTPDLYAAAVDYVGISNLFTFLNTIPPYWSAELTQMHQMIGDPKKDVERFRATSPVLHADKIKTPLFIAQGAKDPRTNINESDQMLKALKAQGVTVEYMVKDNEGHGFYNQENRYDFYRAMQQFLVKHLKPEQN